jgi:hypothetical protein
MPHRWLQIKGDPMIRAFLFQQQRVESLFDQRIDAIHRLVIELMASRGVFHAKLHYSSSQLTCWFFDDPMSYTVYVKEEVCGEDLLSSLPPLSYEGRKPRVDLDQIGDVLEEFKRLRTADETLYLRAGSINRINGMIGMNFSCDGSHYIEVDEFFERLEQFAKG